MSRSRLFAPLIAFVLLALSNLTAQQAVTNSPIAAKDEKSAATFAVHVDEVDLSFAVTDRHHRWITDLSENEIRLRDNGRPPESIRIFQSRTGLPLRVGLAVDTSDSITRQFAFEKEAAILFISTIVDSKKDRAFILGFNSQPTLEQDLTGNTQALVAGVQRLVLGGATAIYDAVNFSFQKLLQQTDNGPARRVLILITDGDDNMSHLKPEQIIEQALRCNVVVIVLDTETEPKDDDPKYRVLQKLTRETGGEILPAANKKQITKAFAQLSSQLRSYYLLAYHPAQFIRDGSYRKIELKSTRRGLHIICRRGYYAARDARER